MQFTQSAEGTVTTIIVTILNRLAINWHSASATPGIAFATVVTHAGTLIFVTRKNNVIVKKITITARVRDFNPVNFVFGLNGRCSAVARVK